MNERRVMTFSQQMGYEEMPKPLQLEELPASARTQIWNVLYVHLDQSKKYNHVAGYDIGDPWQSILRRLYIWHDMQPLDEWTDEFGVWRDRLRNRVEHDRFNHVFDLIQLIMQHKECPQSFLTMMDIAFRSCHLAYVIHAGPPPTILQATTPEERDQLKKNLDEIHSAGMLGGATHLRSASQHINDGNWADSVRESINAVESVAKQIDPAGAKSLGKALDSLQKRGVLQHKALKDAFSKLYGYTSDEQGIRHALLDGDKTNVTVDEAVFMLGACASFASYLWRKHKAAAP